MYIECVRSWLISRRVTIWRGDIFFPNVPIWKIYHTVLVLRGCSSSRLDSRQKLGKWPTQTPVSTRQAQSGIFVADHPLTFVYFPALFEVLLFIIQTWRGKEMQSDEVVWQVCLSVRHVATDSQVVWRLSTTLIAATKRVGTRKKTSAETNTMWPGCAIEVLVLLQTASMRQYWKTRVSVLGWSAAKWQL